MDTGSWGDATTPEQLNAAAEALRPTLQVPTPSAFLAYTPGPYLRPFSLAPFVTSVAELSTTILLYTPSTMTIPIAIYIQVYNTDLGLAACLGLVQIAIVVLALLLVNRTIGIRALRL